MPAVEHHPEPDQPDPYIPSVRDVDPHAEDIMHLGKVDDHDHNDLRDPFFHTAPGRAWLEQHGEL